MSLKTILVIAVGFASSAAGATLTGPVTGGERGSAFGAVDAAGYVNEEYFLAGSAAAYELAEGEQTPDGLWKTRPASDKADFKTRLLVVRPEDPDAFNGTVIVFWLNVTAGFELGSASGEALRGYAWVGVSAQKIGIDGFPQDPQGLKAWDVERYGSLVHPGDAYSYDIFTQAARAVGTERDTSEVDPMGGLEVERLIAVGASQSAGRLRTYINGVHQHTGVFDGYIPFIDFGRGASFASEGAGGRRGGRSSIRSDLDVPVIVVNSETEVTSYYGVREEDSNRFRLWEVAGTSHVSVPRPRKRTPVATGCPTARSTMHRYGICIGGFQMASNRPGCRASWSNPVPVKPQGRRYPKSCATITATRWAASVCRTSRCRRLRTVASGYNGQACGSASSTAWRRISTARSSPTCTRTARTTSRRGERHSTALWNKAWCCPKTPPRWRTRQRHGLRAWMSSRRNPTPSSESPLFPVPARVPCAPHGPTSHGTGMRIELDDYDHERDFAAVDRIYSEVGWLDGSDDATKKHEHLAAAVYEGIVFRLDGEGRVRGVDVARDHETSRHGCRTRGGHRRHDEPGGAQARRRQARDRGGDCPPG